MSPRPYEPEKRIEQILEAATEVFARKGFHEAPMEDIAAAAGLSKGALYLYFKGKDDVILGLLDRVYFREMRDAERLAEESSSATQRLLTFVRMGVQELKRLKPLTPVMYEFVALAARREAVRKIISEYWHRDQELLARIIRQGIETGEFEPVDPEAAAVSLIALLEGLALIGFVDAEFVDWDTLGDFSVRTFLDGLRKQVEYGS